MNDRERHTKGMKVALQVWATPTWSARKPEKKKKI